MMKISVWQGFHSPEIATRIRKAWEEESLLLLLPPGVELSDELSLIRQASFPDKPIFGLCSSGTSGRKLIFYSKKNILSSLQGILSLFEAHETRQVFCYPQPFHTFGLVLGYCHSFLYGKKLIAPEGPYSADSHRLWLDTLVSGQMTLGTPTHFKDLIQTVQAQKINPSPSQTSVIGAAQVERSLWQSIRSVLHIQHPSIGYGATEASPGITHLPPGQEPLEEGEIGPPLPHVSLHLHERGYDFSGPNVCVGILERGSLAFPTTITIQDHLEKRADGHLVYRGRKDLLLNRGGEKFSLEAIERLLKERLGIETLCTSIPDSRLGEELGILSSAPPILKETVFALLKKHFGREFNPAYFHALDQLPFNANSKLDRQSGQRTIEKLNAQLHKQLSH